MSTLPKKFEDIKILQLIKELGEARVTDNYGPLCDFSFQIVHKRLDKTISEKDGLITANYYYKDDKNKGIAFSITLDKKEQCFQVDADGFLYTLHPHTIIVEGPSEYEIYSLNKVTSGERAEYYNDEDRDTFLKYVKVLLKVWDPESAKAYYAQYFKSFDKDALAQVEDDIVAYAKERKHTYEETKKYDQNTLSKVTEIIEEKQAEVK